MNNKNKGEGVVSRYRKDILENWEKWVDKKGWFVEALRDKYIDYWDFNWFAIGGQAKPLICIRKEDLEKWKKLGYYSVRTYQDLALIEKQSEYAQREHI